MPPVIIGAALAAAGAAAGTGIALATGLTVVAAGATMASTIAAAAIMGAAAGALGGAAQMFSAPKPFRQEARDRNLTVRQAINPRQIVYGQVRTGGPIVFLHTTGDPNGVNKNKWLHLIIVLATHEVQEIGDIYFDDDVVPLGTDGYVESGKYYYTGDRDGHWQPQWERGMAYVKKYLGAPGQVADPDLIAASEGKWTADHIGNSIAYLYVRLEWNVDIYKSGIPNITALVKGRKVVDPRDGLTKWTSNAALCLRDYMMIPVAKGGLGVTAAEFDSANWIASTSLCDEVVLGEPRYSLNGTVVMSSANAPKATIEGMLSAMAGTLVYAGGTFRVMPAAFRTPTFTLTERDLRDSVTFKTRTSRRENFNAVKGQYTSPEKKWQLADYPPVVSTTAAAEDGGETIFRDIDRPFTTSGATAQRLAKIDLLRTRQPIVVDIPCQLTAMQCQAGDVIHLTLARYGWAAKAFEVIGWTFAIADDGALGIDLSLKETHPSVFDYLTSENQTVDPAPGTTLPDWTNVAPPRNVSVDSSASLVLIGADGSMISRVLVTWTPADDAFVGTYEVQWRLTGTTTWPNEIRTSSYEAAIDNAPVGTLVDVRVRSVNSLGSPSNYITVTGHQVTGYSNNPNPAVTGLKVEGSAPGSPGVWNTLDVTFVWTPSTIGILFDTYVVEIREGASATGTLRRTVLTHDPLYVYDWSANATDGLSRTITVVVKVRTRLGAVSEAAVLFASNPAPALPTAVDLQGGVRTLTMRYVPPNEPDYAGLRLWRSTVSGFTPDDSNLAYDGPDTFIVINGEPGVSYFVRYASYDAFGKTGLILSAEQLVKTVRIDHTDLVNEAINSTHLYVDLNRRIDAAEYTALALLDLAVVVDANSERGRAAILAERTARVTETEALARMADALVVAMDNNAAAIVLESTTRATETDALAQNIEFLTATTTAQAAAILTESTTRASADQTLAQSTQTLTTSVNGLTTSVQTQASSINGLYGQYTVKVDVNGYVSGYGLASTVKDSVPTASFQVLADSFIVAKPGVAGGDPIVPFVINTAHVPPVMSFQGYVSVDHLTSGTVETETIIIGPADGGAGQKVIVDGPGAAIRVYDGTRDLVRMGKHVDNSYGLTITDTAGNTVLTSAGLAAGVIRSTHLGTGLSSNRLYNSDFLVSLDGWQASDTSAGAILMGRNLDGSNTIQGTGVLYFAVAGTPASGSGFTVANAAQGGLKYPIVGGRRYEASALVGQYRAGYVQILFDFYRADGSYAGNAFGNQITVTGPFQRLDQLSRTSVFATAPADATSCQIRLWVQCNGGTNPHGIATQVFFAEAGPNQVEPSAWTPGPSPLSYAQVTGLNALATTTDMLLARNTLELGSFSTLSQITSANVSTFIQSAAIQSAHINTLTADKLAAGTLSTATWLSCANTVVVDGGNGGRLYIQHPTNFSLKAYMGYSPGHGDYGFWLYDTAGAEVMSASGLAGTHITNATIGTLKIGVDQVTVPRSSSTTSAIAATGTGNSVTVLSVSVPLSQPGRLVAIASIGQGMPSGSKAWNVQIYINGTPVANRGGTTGFADAVALSGDLAVDQGTHTVEVKWAAEVTTSFLGGNLTVLGAMR